MSLQLLEDLPISNSEDDFFGLDSFTDILASALNACLSKQGFVVGLSGKWGVGKSSAVNLVRTKLDPNVKVLNFQSWRIRGEDALVLNFFQLIRNELQPSWISDQDIDEILLGLAEGLIKSFPGPIPVSISSNPLKRRFNAKYSAEGCYKTLYSVCERSPEKYLILIDDIDRLSPNEMTTLFQMVKSVMNLPNISFLLIFDRELAEEACQEVFHADGASYLDKIVQLSFEIPEPSSSQISAYIFEKLQKQIQLADEDLEHLKKVLNSRHLLSVATIREAIKLLNSLFIKWPVLNGEVNISDLLLLELLHIKSISTYKQVRRNRYLLCHVNEFAVPEEFEKLRKRFTEIFNEKKSHSTQVMALLEELFPRFSGINVSNNAQFGIDDQALKERRVRLSQYFDNYFRFEVNPSVIPMKYLKNFIENAEDVLEIKQFFVEQSRQMHSDGQSGLAKYLIQLRVHQDKLSKEKSLKILSALSLDELLYRVKDVDESSFYMSESNIDRMLDLFKLLVIEKPLDEEDIGLLIREAYLPLKVFLFHTIEKLNSWSQEKINRVCVEIVDAIHQAYDSDNLIDYPGASNLLFFWQQYDPDFDEVKIKEWFNNAAKDAVKLEKILKLAVIYAISSDGSRPPHLAWTGPVGFIDLHFLKMQAKELEESSSICRDFLLACENDGY